MQPEPRHHVKPKHAPCGYCHVRCKAVQLLCPRCQVTKMRVACSGCMKAEDHRDPDKPLVVQLKKQLVRDGLDSIECQTCLYPPAQPKWKITVWVETGGARDNRPASEAAQLP